MKNFSRIFTLFILLVFSAPIFAQTYYDTQWKKVADNYKQGLYKSNLPIILDIQNQAMKDDNATQLIRSLKAEFSIVNQTQDDTKNDAASQFFRKLEGLEQKLNGEEKLVYQVLLGEFFNDYYRQNQWRINQRTNINSQDFSQIETWSKLDFKNCLTSHFGKLEKESAALKNISMPKYNSIFEATQDLEYFPTLYDWNSVQYIEFLKHTGLFTPNEIKVNHTKINEIYDGLIAKNSRNSKLYFQHKKLDYNCTFTNCKDRLQQLKNLYESATEGDYKVMLIDDIIDELLKENKHKEAMIWVETAKKIYPKSPFLENIKNKENQIVNPFLSIKFESHTQPEKPIHLVAQHKNVDEFSLNIYAVKDDEQGFLKYVQNSYEKQNFTALKKTLVRKDNFSLQNLKDFKTYKTALELKALPSGIYVAEYVVEGAIQENFYFIVTNSRIIFENKDNRNNAKTQLKLVNRENGKAIASESLIFNEFVRGAILQKSNGKTDGKGIFSFPSSKNDDYYRYYLVKQPGTNDYNLVNHYGRDYYYDEKPKEPAFQAQIFLDRAIYRPGQTVYFKVITTKLLNEKEQVVAGQKQEITLSDANGEELSKQSFTTNDFGSYHGSFTLPKGKLNGEFSLQVESAGVDNSGYKSFRVEEYKRPKFEVTFEPVKGEYKYGQTLELHGKAMTFSGIPLSNATVNYEIKKRNIRWMYFWWYPRGNSNENSILGTVKTNEKGEFTIKVDLKKDETLDGIQVDNYEFNASVTDINGETQSATENVKVASVSHYIKTDDVMDTFTDENIKIKVETKNYNDQNLNKSYTAKLSKLEAPKRVFRDNFVQEIQDLPKLSEAEFIQKFPHDRYDKNDLAENWKVEKIVKQSVILNGAKQSEESQKNSKDSSLRSSAQNDNMLDIGQLAAGTYKLELYNIEGKDTIKTEKRFEVFDKRFLVDSQKPFLKVLTSKNELKRGEKTTVYAYSAIPDAIANIYVQTGNGETLTLQKPFKNGVMQYDFTAPNNEAIDAVNIQIQVVAYNDVQTQHANFKIVSDKKPLRIETVTFRDKLQPNSKEKWTVKILGDDKESVNAEVLANMYDMSLDQFAPNTYAWQTMFYRPFLQNNYDINDGLLQEQYSKRIKYFNEKYVQIPQFNWFDGGIYGGNLRNQSGIKTKNYSAPPAPMATMAKREVAMDAAVESAAVPEITKQLETTRGTANQVEKEDLAKIPIRLNLNETAFFYPNLMTDKDGNVNFEFTSPEALTQWKMMFLAHTKDARSAYLEKEVVTQKEFSVNPNYPRFFREGDEMNLQAKLSSLVDKKLNGATTLQILDAETNEDISSKFGLNNAVQNFNLNENGNTVANWKIKVPNDVSSIILKIVATSTSLSDRGTYSDGEQKAIAILPNRMLVTDAVPIFVKEGQTKTFVLENLAKNTSTTATNVANSLELTTNPIWEVMFALPSLKDDQNLSADVQFNKWFADVLASEIFKANPRMKTVFEEYQDKGLLTSNLEKNQELKQLLLEETPWILESKNEAEQMQKLARIFDANTMRNSITQDWEDLKKLQNPDGGFSWYPGYPSSYSTSLYILKNLGKINEWLKGNLADYQSGEQKEMVSKLVNFVDSEVYKYWDTSASLARENVWNNYVLDYLDSRHYFEKEFPLKGKGAQLKDLVIKKAPTAKITDFTFFGLHRAALLFDYYKLTNLSKKLLTYLKETSTNTETQGVYWKQNLNDWGWYSSKTVNHAGALEAFNKLAPTDQNFIEEMKIWLITQKEVSNWDTSRSTAEVIFTILNSGKSWTSAESDKATVIWGGKNLAESTPSLSERAGVRTTGYVKSIVKPDQIDKNLGTVTVTKPGAGIVQGGLFWQYYEDLDRIKSSETYLSITKEIYRKVKTVNGEELQKITAQTPLRVGDKVTVRMILNTDRNMEFIHLKDMRGAGFEPVDALSGYQWKNNLGYYQSTKDASTNFYIQYMPKGKYVFEYDLICNASGTFSNGISTLQNYYAPQMNAHTKGTKVSINE